MFERLFGVLKVVSSGAVGISVLVVSSLDWLSTGLLPRTCPADDISFVCFVWEVK